MIPSNVSGLQVLATLSPAQLPRFTCARDGRCCTATPRVGSSTATVQDAYPKAAATFRGGHDVHRRVVIDDLDQQDRVTRVTRPRHDAPRHPRQPSPLPRRPCPSGPALFSQDRPCSRGMTAGRNKRLEPVSPLAGISRVDDHLDRHFAAARFLRCFVDNPCLSHRVSFPRSGRKRLLTSPCSRLDCHLADPSDILGQVRLVTAQTLANM